MINRREFMQASTLSVLTTALMPLALPAEPVQRIFVQPIPGRWWEREFDTDTWLFRITWREFDQSHNRLSIIGVVHRLTMVELESLTPVGLESLYDSIEDVLLSCARLYAMPAQAFLNILTTGGRRVVTKPLTSL